MGLASFAASAISRADPVKTGVQAFRYEMRTAILPLLFIFNHQLLLIGVDKLVPACADRFRSPRRHVYVRLSHTADFHNAQSYLGIRNIAVGRWHAVPAPAGLWTRVVPEYMPVPGNQVIELAEQVPENGFLRVEVTGVDIITGVEQTRVMRLPMGEIGPGAERLSAVGVQTVSVGDAVQVLGAGFGSQAERLGIEAGQTITRVFVADPNSPANELIYIPRTCPDRSRGGPAMAPTSMGSARHAKTPDAAHRVSVEYPSRCLMELKFLAAVRRCRTAPR